MSSSKTRTVLSFRNVTKKYSTSIDLGRRRHFFSMFLPFLSRADTLKKAEFFALKDISFSLQQGERLALLGGKGAGKSTIARLTAQLSTPTSGKVKVSQQTRIVQRGKLAIERPLMSVELYVQTAVSLLGAPWGEVRSISEEVISNCNLSNVRKVRVRDLPPGYLAEPTYYASLRVPADIFIFDDAPPPAFPELEQAILQNKTVLVLASSREKIPSVFNRTMVLHSGAIQFDGPTPEAKSVYATLPPEGQPLDSLTNAAIKDFDADEQLEHEKKRKGSGILRYVSATLLSAPLQTGGTLKLEFRYRKRKQVPAKHITNATVIIEDRFGTRMLGAPAYVTNVELGVVKDTGSLHFEIEKLPLLPGQYFVTYDIHVDGMLSDKVIGKLKLTVEPGDFYQTGELPSSGMGPFCVPFQWDSAPKLPEAT